MDQSVPIPTLHLFPVLNKLLIDLLKSLSPEEWNRPTLAPLWSVKDIAAHLLDTNMRAISSAGNYVSPDLPPDITSYQQLVSYLNELNSDWVKAMKRVSPGQLISLLENTSNQYVNYLSSLDPWAQSKYSVAWAGEEPSKNWFHIAREYTEKWHHQQQIRDAVGNTEALMARELFYPCIDTFMCGLPHAYRNVEADANSNIKITINGNSGGDWYLIKETNMWVINKTTPKITSIASVIIEPGIAWKLFTKGISPEHAIERSVITGNIALAKNIFNLIAVIA